MAETEKKAEANPTKSFFVNMITRDITLEDCILDLIDNSVDGAWRSEGSRPMGLADGADLSKYKISIEAKGNKFSIRDNSGGMTLDEAVDHAFSFGRKASEETDEYSIGVYGIGMKRAVFKLGNKIKVRSTYSDEKARKKRSAFAVPIDVLAWLASDALPWEFDIEDDELLAENGVEIVVEDLNEATSSSFGSEAFIQNLRRTIGRDYTLHLNRGLKIELNDVPVVGWKIELRESEDFAPMRKAYDDSGVAVEVIGGMAAPPPETNDPSDVEDSEKSYGWYVVCNGRIVLAADRTAVSGWGTEEWPQWHRQYAGFIGIILFTAPNAASLPLTTTKRSVDTQSDVYRRARPVMRALTKQWIAYTNQRKQALDEAKEKEEEAKRVSIYSVAPRETASLPALVTKGPIVQRDPVANVAYSVPIVRMRKLARELGNTRMPYREVGLKAFEYTYADLVGDE